MKVYVLSKYNNETGSEFTFATFDRPKTARKWVDSIFGGNSKNKWTKMDDGSRSYSPGDYPVLLILTEYDLIKE